MKKIDIISNDKIYAEMLCLELRAAGYNASEKHSGNADIIIREANEKGDERTVTFSEREGADLLRPFDIDSLTELIRQKKARSEQPDAASPLLYVSPKLNYALCRGERVELSELEHKLLLILYENKGMAVEPQTLSREVFQKESNNNLVRVYINYLREKIDKRFGLHLIKTVRNKGYMLNE